MNQIPSVRTLAVRQTARPTSAPTKSAITHRGRSNSAKSRKVRVALAHAGGRNPHSQIGEQKLAQSGHNVRDRPDHAQYCLHERNLLGHPVAEAAELLQVDVNQRAHAAGQRRAPARGEKRVRPKLDKSRHSDKHAEHACGRPPIAERNRHRHTKAAGDKCGRERGRVQLESQDQRRNDARKDSKGPGGNRPSRRDDAHSKPDEQGGSQRRCRCGQTTQRAEQVPQKDAYLSPGSSWGLPVLGTDCSGRDGRQAVTGLPVQRRALPLESQPVPNRGYGRRGWRPRERCRAGAPSREHA